MIRALMIPRFLRRAERNAQKFYGGPTYWREPCPAPSVRDAFTDLDGMDRAAELRARALKMRRTVAKLRGAR